MNKREIQQYLKWVTKKEPIFGRNPLSYSYQVGNDFQIDIDTCVCDLKSKKSMMNLWKKAGYIEKTFPTYLSVQTYYTNSEGQCIEAYNITHKLESRIRNRAGTDYVQRDIKLNFDYVLEATEENFDLLAAECIRLYLKDKGIVIIDGVVCRVRKMKMQNERISNYYTFNLPSGEECTIKGLEETKKRIQEILRSQKN